MKQLPVSIGRPCILPCCVVRRLNSWLFALLTPCRTGAGTTKKDRLLFHKPLVQTGSSSIRLAAHAYIAEEAVLLKNPDALSFPFQSELAPDWVEIKILDDGLDDMTRSLLIALELFPGFDSVDVDVHQVAIRILCLHHWRRIALREVSWLHLKHYEHGHTRYCHDLTHQLLVALPRMAAKAIMERY